MKHKQQLNERKVKALESIAESLLFLKHLAGKMVQFDDSEIDEQNSSSLSSPFSSSLMTDDKEKMKDKQMLPAKPTKRKIGFDI